MKSINQVQAGDQDQYQLDLVRIAENRGGEKQYVELISSNQAGLTPFLYIVTLPFVYMILAFQ